MGRGPEVTPRPWLLVALLTAAGCVIDPTGAPCADQTHCPRGQHCGAAGRCVLGSAAPTDLLELQLSPENATLPLGSRVQLLALGKYADGSLQELTSLVVWSAASARVSVSNSLGSRGVVSALEQGATEIVARLGEVEGRTVLFVTEPALVGLELSPPQPSIALNTTVQFVATGTYTDASTRDLSSQAAWSSSQPTVGQVSNQSGSRGLATALTQGTSTIRAEVAGVAGQTLLISTNATLSALSITPTNPVRAPGTAQRFIATGRFSDGTTQDVSSLVSWSSGAPAVASISNSPEARGLATMLSAGQTTIEAALAGLSALTVLTVSTATLTAVSVSPTDPSMARGSTLPLKATALFSDATTQDVTEGVAWRSSDGGVVTVSDEAGSRGQVRGVSVGAARVSASAAGVTGSTLVQVTAATLTGLAVTPISPTLGVGTTQAFTATGTYSDGTTQDVTAAASWSSTDPSRLSISNATGTRGVGTAVASGSATITASLSGLTGSTPVTVSGAALASLSVNPASTSVPLGSTRSFFAVGTFSDASMQDLTAQCTWASSASSVATLSNADGSRGVATPLAVGSTTVTASLSAKQGSAALTVTAATLTSLALSPVNASVPGGTTRQYAAQGTWSDGSTEDLTEQVTWLSSATQVATISNAATSRGLVSALTIGTTSISATLGGVSAATPLTVTEAMLVSIAVTPINATLFLSAQQQFTAVGSYSDGSIQPLTQQVTWSSSSPAVVAISNASDSKGRAFAQAPGTSTISATLGPVLGQTAVTVSSSGMPP